MFVSAAAVEPRGSTEPDVATGHHGGVRAGGSTRGSVEGGTWERCEYLPGGVWREGPGRDVSIYPGGGVEGGARERCEYIPREVWREGPGRDVSIYPGECGGRGWEET